jgi:predicted glutamine amidotransferase
MCALLGMNFTQPVSAGFSFQEVGLWSADNADGWGLAWYPDQSAALVKEPAQWGTSPYLRFLHTYQQLHSRIYLAHVRHRTVGGPPTHADTHPFLRECGGRHYCFAHNGTLPDAARLAVKQFQPVGGTDSERLFCHLLGELNDAGCLPLESEESWCLLHDKLQTLNKGANLNCLLADGKRLFGYFDVKGWKGLTMCPIYLLGEGKHHFDDPNVHVEVGDKHLNRGIVLATHPLSSQGWNPLRTGELVVLEEGRLRYSSAA